MSVSLLRREENDGYFTLEESTGRILLEESSAVVAADTGVSFGYKKHVDEFTTDDDDDEVLLAYRAN